MFRFAIPSALLLTALVAVPAAAQTWAPQDSGTGADLADVHFLDASTGFAVAGGGLLLSTTDGGQTWSTRTLFGGDVDLEGVDFNPSGTVGLIATGDGPVARSTDGGQTWTLVATGASDLRVVDWAGDGAVWVAGRDGDSAVSTDGGQTWTYHNTGSADRTEGVAAVSALEAWVVNRGGEIRHTADGGATWATQPSGTGSDLADIQMLDASTGYVAGESAVLKTTNGGATWVDVAGGNASGNGLFFLDATTGWVVGDAGAIWFTNDGGASWMLQPSGTSRPLARVHFPTGTDGWAVGDGGAVVRFSLVATAAEPAAAPGAFALSEAAPNPARGSARLALALAEAEAVRVEVYDALGRRVAVLLDGSVEAGTHTLVLDGAALPAGIYVVRVAGKGFAATRRLTLTR